MKLYSMVRRLLPYILLLLSTLLAVFALWSWGVDYVEHCRVDKTVGKVQMTEHPDGKNHSGHIREFTDMGRIPQKTRTVVRSFRNKPSPGYLGVASCAECHRERYDQFVETAHHKTFV